MNSIESLLRWSVVLFGIRLLFSLPVSHLLRVNTRGFVLPLVIMVWGYIYWIQGTLGVPIEWRQGSSIFFCILGYIFYWISARGQLRKKELLQSEEFVFWSVFFLCVIIRSKCSAWTGSEKFPDLLFFQASLLDDTYPPMDRWLPPFRANYYYVSYVLFVPLYKLAGISVEYFVNLVIPTISAMLASAAYGFVWERTSSRSFSFLSALYAAIFGNWEWLKQVHDKLFVKYFSWWNSSRAIPYTITEFPFFSFLLGDFHPHFNSLPWFLLSLWIIVKLRDWPNVFLVGLAIGIHYPMNAWELPVLALVCAFVHRGHLWRLATIAGLSYLFFLPFWLTYEKPVSGIHFVSLAQRSSAVDFLYHWAPYLFPLVVLCLPYVRKKEWWKYLLACAAFFLGQSVGIIALCALLFEKIVSTRTRLEAYLVYFALALILFCEFFSLDPTYGAQFLRMNTVFKFYMLAWLMLALAVPCLLFKIKSSKIATAFAILMCLVYPVRATLVRWKEMRVSTPTLDGLQYWDAKFPKEREAVDWIRKNTGSKDVILEAFGKAYQEYGRYSVFTGRPTILGWFNHEQVWRSGGYLLATDRQKDIEFFQRGSEPIVLENILENHRVRWIVLGKLERQTFHASTLAWIASLPLAFQNEGVSIYSFPKPSDTK